MASTGIEPTPIHAVSTNETREALAEQNKMRATRVAPGQESDDSASFTERSPEDRIAEIDELAASALKNSRLSIERDESSGDIIYYMVDQDTGEEVRRWPPESRADLTEFLRSSRAGLIDKSA
jgi:uncharacterized FlaG/YvyC family protein